MMAYPATAAMAAHGAEASHGDGSAGPVSAGMGMGMGSDAEGGRSGPRQPKWRPTPVLEIVVSCGLWELVGKAASDM